MKRICKSFLKRLGIGSVPGHGAGESPNKLKYNIEISINIPPRTHQNQIDLIVGQIAKHRRELG